MGEVKERHPSPLQINLISSFSSRRPYFAGSSSET
jgi:hypothetical protein